jgi:hypothetical protein
MVVLTSGVSVPAEWKANACIFIVEHCSTGASEGAVLVR